MFGRPKRDRSTKIYIIPTRFGFVYALAVGTMLMVGAAYGNNLVNLIAFFLASIGLVTMLQTHNNLKRISISQSRFEPGFANQATHLRTLVASTATEAHPSLEVEVPKLKPLARLAPPPDVPAQGRLKLETSFLFAKRGRFRLKRIKLSTVYPIGLFYAWRYKEIENDYFIYPQPKGLRRWPMQVSDAGLTSIASQRGGDDFREHRRFQPGDSQRHIDWRAHARGRPLLTKRFDDGSPHAVNFEWSQVSHLSFEDALSQLTLWIDIALKSETPFSLRLPTVALPANTGWAHAHACWRELALMEPT
jgi:uncharacterized protein (DUF58 family)